MRLIFIISLSLMFSPISFSAIDIGKSLYMKHCSACHGASGNGGVGVPLALKSFQSQASDRFLKNTIRFGRKGRVMPAFSKLSESELTALVSHIRSFSNEPAPVYSQVRISGDTQNGASLYSQHCVTCHGFNGKGGKGTGVTFSRPRDFPIIAPALNNVGFLKSASDAMIQKTLLEGRDGTPMESYLKKGLSKQDIDDIVAYIRSFDDKPEESIAVGDEPYYLEVESVHSLEKTIKNLKQAIVGKNYRLIRVQHLDNGFVNQKKENKKRVVVYFCNFELLNEALAVDPRVGLFLPCRLTVVEYKGKVTVMAINPTHLSRLFNNDELTSLCKGMRETYEGIMDEATL